MPKSMQIALAWPMCSWPFGSGGKRVTTRPPCLPEATSCGDDLPDEVARRGLWTAVCAWARHEALNYRLWQMAGKCGPKSTRIRLRALQAVVPRRRKRRHAAARGDGAGHRVDARGAVGAHGAESRLQPRRLRRSSPTTTAAKPWSSSRIPARRWSFTGR